MLVKPLRQTFTGRATRPSAPPPPASKRPDHDTPPIQQPVLTDIAAFTALTSRLLIRAYQELSQAPGVQPDAVPRRRGVTRPGSRHRGNPLFYVTNGDADEGRNPLFYVTNRDADESENPLFYVTNRDADDYRVLIDDDSYQMMRVVRFG